MVSSMEDDSVYSSSFTVSGREALDPKAKVSKFNLRDDREITEDENTERLTSARSLKDEKFQSKLSKLKLNLEDSQGQKGS